jgi:hypothetical protein
MIVNLKCKPKSINYLPSHVKDVSNGKGIGKVFELIGKEHDSAVSVPEVHGSVGGVHRLVNDFDLLDVLVFLMVKVSIR